MIEGLQPYAEYKESEQRWLGQIPASWALRRAKFLFREVDERSVTGKEELLSVSRSSTPGSSLAAVQVVQADGIFRQSLQQPGQSAPFPLRSTARREFLSLFRVGVDG